MNKVKAEDYVYKPRGYRADPNHKNDKSRCEAEVSDHDSRSASYYQCRNKPVEFIQGIGFCKAHALKVNRGLGLLKANATKYVAELRYNEPCISRLSIASETEKRIDIISSKKLIGDLWITEGLQNKNDRYSHDREYFDNYESALMWLLKESQSELESAETNLDVAIKNKLKIDAMVKKLAG
jgi:hypothetical protein